MSGDLWRAKQQHAARVHVCASAVADALKASGAAAQRWKSQTATPRRAGVPLGHARRSLASGLNTEASADARCSSAALRCAREKHSKRRMQSCKRCAPLLRLRLLRLLLALGQVALFRKRATASNTCANLRRRAPACIQCTHPVLSLQVLYPLRFDSLQVSHMAVQASCHVRTNGPQSQQRRRACLDVRGTACRRDRLPTGTTQARRPLVCYLRSRTRRSRSARSCAQSCSGCGALADLSHAARRRKANQAQCRRTASPTTTTVRARAHALLHCAPGVSLLRLHTAVRTGDVGSVYYGANHPMKPHRLVMTHHLVMAYDLHKRMEIYVRARGGARMLSNPSAAQAAPAGLPPRCARLKQQSQQHAVAHGPLRVHVWPIADACATSLHRLAVCVSVLAARTPPSWRSSTQRTTSTSWRA